jgi:hypothetical protein
MVRGTRAGLCAAPGHGPLNQRHGRRLPKRNHPAGATAATNVRDLRDWTRATSLPAADGNRTPTEVPIDRLCAPDQGGAGRADDRIRRILRWARSWSATVGCLLTVRRPRNAAEPSEPPVAMPGWVTVTVCRQTPRALITYERLPASPRTSMCRRRPGPRRRPPAPPGVERGLPPQGSRHRPCLPAWHRHRSGPPVCRRRPLAGVRGLPRGAGNRRRPASHRRRLRGHLLAVCLR